MTRKSRSVYSEPELKMLCVTDEPVLMASDWIGAGEGNSIIDDNFNDLGEF